MVLLSHRYSPVNIDDDWGSTIDIDLKNTDLVQDYDLVVVPGTLSGGTSPAYSYSYLNPVVQSVKVQGDNNTYLSADVPQLNEMLKLVRGVSTPSGTSVKIHMNALDFSTRKYLKAFSYPSYAFVNNTMQITLPPLSQITTGSPTGTSGSQLYLTEHVVSRQSVDFKLFPFKMLKISSSLGLTGDNDLTNYLSTDAYYQALLHFVSTSQGSYTSGSNSTINYMDLILNNEINLFSDYYYNIQSGNLNEFGTSPDTGFALQTFMNDTDLSDLLNLSSSIVNKTVNLKVNTFESGYLTTLKMVMF